jgi:hypothetical protein
MNSENLHRDKNSNSQDIQPVSFKSYFSEAIFSKHAYEYLLILFVIFKGLSYWAISKWQHPDEPLSVIAMYRVGDIEYYPLISALSNLQFSETVIYELAGKGLASFPFASTAIHAFFYGVFGVAGFILADVLVVLSYYILLVGLLRILGIPKLGASLTSLFIVSGAANYGIKFISDFLYLNFIATNPALAIQFTCGLFAIIAVVLVALYQKNLSPKTRNLLIGIGILATVAISVLLLSTFLFEFWGWRIPRPFVTELFLILCLAGLSYLLIHSPATIAHKKVWILLGLSTSALLQGDFHSAVIVAIAICALVIYFFCIPNLRRTAFQGYLLLLLSGTLFSLPFLWQRWVENPDVPIRLGVFSIDRTQPIWMPGTQPYLIVLGVLLYALFLIRLTQLFAPSEIRQKRILGICLFWGLSAIACFAMPISLIVIGKGVQLYHFFDRFLRIQLITFLIFSLYGGELLFQFVQQNRQSFLAQLQNKSSLKQFAIVIVLTLSLLISLREAVFISANAQHMRPDFPEWESLKNYRQNFSELVQELSKPNYQNQQVLATFDVQTYVWWVAFQEKNSYLPSAALSTVADREIEYRLSTLCKLIGMNTENFLNFINRNYVNIFWLGHDKYQASRAHTFSELSDYLPEVQKSILQTGILNSLNVAIPISEQLRLVGQFNQLDRNKIDLPKLDLVVLTTDQSLQGFAPPADEFDLTYRNAVFNVWQRKQPG